MRLPTIALGLIAASAVLAGPAAAPAQPAPLTVCLEEDSPPFSYKFGRRQGGFDLAVANAVADALGRPLQVQWYEGENDEENVPPWEANALLSDGLCNLVGSYPFIASTLGKPTQDTGALPEYDGMRRDERGRLVKMGTLVPSTPYYRSAFAVVLAPSAKLTEVKALGQLQGLRIGAEVSTLSSAILYRNGGGRLIADLAHVPPTKDLLVQMDDGAFDAAMIELHRFDWYRARHAESKLSWSGYVHPLGFNMGFAALERDRELLQLVNAALERLIADGAIEALARENAVTYLAPRLPLILKSITPRMLESG